MVSKLIDIDRKTNQLYYKIKNKRKNSEEFEVIFRSPQ